MAYKAQTGELFEEDIHNLPHLDPFSLPLEIEAHAHLVPGVVQMLPDPVLELFEERGEEDHQDDLGLRPYIIVQFYLYHVI